MAQAELGSFKDTGGVPRPVLGVRLLNSDGSEALAGTSENALPVRPIAQSSGTGVIANGASLSAAIDCGTGRRPVRIVMPAAWTAAVLTVQSSYDGVTYNNLYDSSGTEYTLQAGASRSILLPLGDFIGVRYLKLRSGSSSAAVNQGADRTLTVITQGI